jgi:hypothetical protein
MANKEDFTPEEWTQILESMMLTGIAVSAADPNGLWGALKEAFATSSALAASKLDPASNALVRAAVVDFETSQGRSNVQKALRARFTNAGPTECVQRSLESLRQVSAILDAKAPCDAPLFKAWLCDISQKVAEASMEGSLLGFGGVRVSDSERATLADISKSLGRTARE